MLFSELTGKVIIDIDSGGVIGSVGDVDLMVDEEEEMEQEMQIAYLQKLVES